MLVLTRKPRESVLIDASDLVFGPDSRGNCSLQVRIIVKSIANGQVKIAIDAPRAVRIIREELSADGICPR